MVLIFLLYLGYSFQITFGTTTTWQRLFKKEQLHITIYVIWLEINHKCYSWIHKTMYLDLSKTTTRRVFAALRIRLRYSKHTHGMDGKHDLTIIHLKYLRWGCLHIFLFLFTQLCYEVAQYAYALQWLPLMTTRSLRRMRRSFIVSSISRKSTPARCLLTDNIKILLYMFI